MKSNKGLGGLSKVRSCHCSSLSQALELVRGIFKIEDWIHVIFKMTTVSKRSIPNFIA